MKSVGVFYWSGSGNTEKMAEAIGEGLKKAGVEFDLCNITNGAGDVNGYEKLMFGCPSMGMEVLEEAEFEPFFEEAEKSISGKKVALFGSYGWGDGEWMRNWQDRVSDQGADLFNGEGLVVNETPDDDAVEECIGFGESFAKF
ncbi:flavodoxin [Peptostreptococcus faecalis]|uniref:flavodoxin n=1 Tax=Peptostreptococcus faecalis TaxID=2045015 RepID=UPI000C7E09B0|nr:flavodoxin [Peptostreptococcus faecalis]